MVLRRGRSWNVFHQYDLLRNESKNSFNRVHCDRRSLLSAFFRYVHLQEISPAKTFRVGSKNS